VIKTRKLFPVVVAGALLFSACSSDDSTTETGSNGTAGGGGGDTSLSGDVRLDGSSTVGPLAKVAAELFENETNGKVRVAVAESGTSGGFAKFCIGENDMNNASRAIKDSEIELCAENDIGWAGVQVANDALALLVNTDNPLDCMTVDQANQIWDEGSSVSTWGDIDGLDIPADFASEPITLYGPGTDSGTFDFFTEAINGEEGVIRNDYINIGEDDNAAVMGVQGDVGAMGYVPYSYFQEAGDTVKPLAIDDGNGCVDATLENVLDGSYTPLGRPLFTYASDAGLAKPQVLGFMKFWIANSEEIAAGAGFVPLSDDQVAKSNQDIEDLAS